MNKLRKFQEISLHTFGIPFRFTEKPSNWNPIPHIDFTENSITVLRHFVRDLSVEAPNLKL